MHRRDRRLIAAVVVIALAALAAVIVLATRGSTPKPAGVASDELTTIHVDGVALAAEVLSPKGTGRAPLVVMPASWGGKATMYRVVGARLARAGYQVVAYAQRGWGGSTGEADFAGPATQRDARAVISWALRHTRGDPSRIGMFGMSYGAGISLLTAAQDKRVRAVVATSTWADVAQAFDQNDTPSSSALQVLVGPNRIGNFDPTVRALQQNLVSSPTTLGSRLRAISPVRSPDHYVADLNRNRPAIMVANGFEDSIFNPAQLVPFFQALHTPKRLELAAGDHGGPERAALTGGSSPTVDDAVAWLDHYLRGARNGIAGQPPILLRDIRTAQPHAFRHWPSAGTGEHIALGRPGSSDPAATWTATLHAGVDTVASNGPAQYVAAPSYQPPKADVTAIGAQRGLVWTGAPRSRATTVNGTPQVRVGLTSSSGTASVFAYLYDLAPNGLGTLLDMAPFSATGLAPGASRTVTIAMQPTSYTVPAGDRLALVIDAADPRYTSLAAPGTTITVSSSPAQRATLVVPTSG